MPKKLATAKKLAPMEVAEEVIKLEKLKREVDTRLKEHKANLLRVMLELDVLQLKTGSYTLSRKKYSRVKVVDDEKAEKALEARGVPVETKVVLDMDLMKVPLKALVDSGENIDGVELVESDFVSVRLVGSDSK